MDVRVVEQVVLEDEAVRDRHDPAGRLVHAQPVVQLQHRGAEHLDIDHVAPSAVDFHPVPELDLAAADNDEPSGKRRTQILQGDDDRGAHESYDGADLLQVLQEEHRQHDDDDEEEDVPAHAARHEQVLMRKEARKHQAAEKSVQQNGPDNDPHGQESLPHISFTEHGKIVFQELDLGIQKAQPPFQHDVGLHERAVLRPEQLDTSLHHFRFTF